MKSAIVIIDSIFVIVVVACCLFVASRNVVEGQEFPTARDTSSPSFRTQSVGRLNAFASEYTIVTSKTNFQVNFKRLPNIANADNPGNPNFVLGSSIIQSGNVFRPNSVNLVQVLENFAGGVQPETTPDLNSAFTFNGECVATAGKGFATIDAHTCVFNLCLRGSQNCIFLYAGTAFKFNSAPVISVQPDTFGNNLFKNDFFSSGNKNPLPPSFPGVIIGGVNDFIGITGNFELITVAGTLPFDPVLRDGEGKDSVVPDGVAGNIAPETFAPTATPTTSLPTAIDPSTQPTSRPTFDGTQAPTPLNLEPAIVQKLFVKSNIRLPRAPKATGANNEDEETDNNP
jgi:hypothetical protein